MNEELLFELNPTPLMVCDRETLRLLKGNRKFCEKYKYSVAEVEEQALNLRDIHVPGDHSKLKTFFKTKTDNEAEGTAVWRHQSKDENVFDVKVSLTEVDYQNHPSYLVSAIDITDQVRTDEKSQKAYEELRHHVQNTALALVQWDHKFRIREWSKRAAEISGFTTDEVLGKSADFFKFGDDKESAEIEQSIRSLLTGEKDRDYLDVNIINKQGERRSIKIHSSALRDTDDTLISVLTLIEDYTEQQEAEEKLRRSESLFKKLFTNAPQAIVMVDDENIIQQVNNSFSKLFGYQNNELLGKNIDKIVKPKEGLERAPQISDLKSEDRQIYSELKRYTKEGKELDLVVGGIPVYLDDKLIAGFGIYIDITGQKETQRILQHSLDEKQVLLEEVHHRVKNNLAVVSGLLQMQTLHVDDPQLAQYIKKSHLRIQSMAIVHEMLYKSKTLSQIQMSDYVKKLTEVIAATLGPDNKEIEIEVESESIILNVNQAIPCALIISELISNAYEFAFEAREHGIINVNLSKEDDKICICVRDDGIGLPNNFEEMRKKSLGMSLIENLCDQLDTTVEIDTGEWGTSFGLRFTKQDIAGSSSLNRV